MSEHTPGPWVRSGYPIPRVHSRDAISICEMLHPAGQHAKTWRREDVEQRRTDARLIAAAPELLATLEAALAALNMADQDTYDDGALTGRIRAVVFKATGKEPSDG